MMVFVRRYLYIYSIILLLIGLFACKKLTKIIDNPNAFIKYVGGTGEDIAYDIKPTSDGYIITGVTTSFDNGPQVYLLKLDKNGNKSWEKNFGQSKDIAVTNLTENGLYDVGKSILLTPDGGYLIVGNALVGSDSMQVYVIKTDIDGNMQWETYLGGSSFINKGKSVILNVENDGYVIAGETNQPSLLKGGLDITGYFIWEIDLNGNFVKQSNPALGLDFKDFPGKIIKDEFASYMLIGTSQKDNITSNLKITQVKSDLTEGAAVSEPTIADTSLLGASITAISGGYVVTGTRVNYSLNGGRDLYFAMYNQGNNITRPFFQMDIGKSNNEEGLAIVAADATTAVVVGSQIQPGNLDKDVFLAKIDYVLQDTLWTRAIGGVGDDIAYAIEKTDDGGFVLVGSTILGANKMITIIKIDKDGRVAY